MDELENCAHQIWNFTIFLLANNDLMLRPNGEFYEEINVDYFMGWKKRASRRG